MQHQSRVLLIVLLLSAGLLLSACSTPEIAAKGDEPALVEALEGSEFNRVILMPGAAERLRVATDVITEQTIDGQTYLVAPYASLIYGLNGETWVYTNPESLTYMRAPVTVERIDGEDVILVDGPAVGTAVVTVGVSELLGVDTGVGK